MLEKFLEAKIPELERLIEWERQGRMPAPRAGERPSFAAALAGKKGAVIAEYKRASPSRGEINMRFGPAEIGRAYAASGASAISVLTEEVYFKGSLAYLEEMKEAGLPLLRKDFILHPLQIRETAATAASAVLLIARMLDDRALPALMRQCRELGLDAVVEAFDEEDLERAKEVGAKIIQINNRDLDKLTTDFGVSENLIGLKEKNEIWISASGLSRREEVERMAALGFDAVLIGSSIMAEDDPGAALARLTGRSA